jgi:S1-C subfamily serine protease
MNRIATRGAATGFLALVMSASSVVVSRAGVTLPLVDQLTGTATLAPVVRKILPSVVTISVKRRAQAPNAELKRAHYAKRPEPATAGAIGSGVIVDSRQGLVVTNNHVVERAKDIAVTLVDGRKFTATLVGGDRGTDVAVLKIAAANLTAAPTGNSDQVEVGDFVLAIGAPFTIGETVTAGIVSGVNRNNVGIEKVENFIQTDAAIYRGNSGGALINLRGELIGINTAFVGSTSANPGMGFAIPINMVQIVAHRVLETGDLGRGKLGITFGDASPVLIRQYNLSASTTANTVVITRVESGSSAQRVGLRAGDVITALNAIPVRDTNDLRSRLGLLWVGETAEFMVLRDGKPMDFEAAIVNPTTIRATR